jgi:hypothetical protein
MLVATSACSFLHREQGAPDAAATVAMPVQAVSATPSVSASAKASSVPSGKPRAAGSAEPKVAGNCYCLPDKGTTEHGNNMRTAPTMRPPVCVCDKSGVRLCIDPIKSCKERGTACDESFEALCKRRSGFTGTPGASCQGWSSVGGHETGRLDCNFVGVDTYPGPAGRTCKGFLVTGQSVDGHVFCPAK